MRGGEFTGSGAAKGLSLTLREAMVKMTASVGPDDEKAEVREDGSRGEPVTTVRFSRG
jgi:hypothetical protein